MDYEKAYKDALERAEKLQKTCDNTTIVGWMEYVFPKLKEESEDEKIRKAIVEVVKRFQERDKWIAIQSVSFDKIYAWLEKQKPYCQKEECDIDCLSLEYADNIKEDGEVTHDNITEPYWNFHSIRKAFIDGYLRQKSIKWTEEDEKNFKRWNTWKPSDNQIKAIRLARSFVVDDFGEHPTLSEILMELEKQLQKIKENKQ